MGDIGINATNAILEDLKQKVKEQHIKEPSECKQLLINSIKEQMQVGDVAYRFEQEKSVVLVIGVNGVGKTTSIAKLAHLYKQQGKRVMLAAGDTFRAAAAEQLCVWAERADVPVVKHNEGGGPRRRSFRRGAERRPPGATTWSSATPRAACTTKRT